MHPERITQKDKELANDLDYDGVGFPVQDWNKKQNLLLIDENKSHYVYIKDFDRFMFDKTKNKNK